MEDKKQLKENELDQVSGGLRGNSETEGLVNSLAGGSVDKLAGGLVNNLAGGSVDTLAGGLVDNLAGGLVNNLVGGSAETLAGGLVDNRGRLSARFCCLSQVRCLPGWVGHYNTGR